LSANGFPVTSRHSLSRAELKRERAELKADDKGEHEELMAIYVGRGLDPSLAKQVADQLISLVRSEAS
jgi:VIT1/CCC1 family predicted Fe2+/Mn2+ transporter